MPTGQEVFEQAEKMLAALEEAGFGENPVLHVPQHQFETMKKMYEGSRVTVKLTKRLDAYIPHKKRCAWESPYAAIGRR